LRNSQFDKGFHASPVRIGAIACAAINHTARSRTGRFNAPLNQLLEIIRRIGMRKTARFTGNDGVFATFLARVHTLFVQSRWTGAELHSLVTQELLPYRQDRKTRVRINGLDVMLEPNMAQMVAISLHELATNAAKYGSLSTASGHLEIAWSCTADGWLNLRWTESGGPAVAPPTHSGFGTRILEKIIGGRPGGQVRFDWRDQGLICEIALPLQRPQRPDLPGPTARQFARWGSTSRPRKRHMSRFIPLPHGANVAYWHLADVLVASSDVCFRGQSGHRLVRRAQLGAWNRA
jgi:hypothetical protein